MGPLAVSSQAAPQGATHTAQRVSALVRPASISVQTPMQSVVLTKNNLLFALYQQVSNKRAYLTASSTMGESLWEYELPKGTYSGIGTTDSGNTPLVHAFWYTDSSGTARRNSILQLDPTTGDVKQLGSADSSGSSAVLIYAGDSRFARVTTNQLELWSIVGTARLDRVVDIRGVSGASVRVDPLSAAELALTSLDGTQTLVVNLSSGDTRNISLSSPEIDGARGHLAEMMSYRAPAVGGPFATQAVIAVTGGDGASGVLYGLIYPVKIGAPVPLISIESSGSVTGGGLYELTGKLPIKLVKTGSELGIIYSDGTISWYSA